MKLRVVEEVNVVVTWGLVCMWCCLEGLESRYCLIGLLDVSVPMELPTCLLLEEISCEMFALETLTCDFWRKSRAKRLFRRL